MSGEAPFRGAAAAAAHEINVLGHPGPDGLGFKVITKKRGIPWPSEIRYSVN